jgi:hypothetical protein
MPDLETTDLKFYDASHTQNLLNKVNSLLVKNNFKQGDLIVWKNGLRNKKLPNEGQPAVVLEVLSTPLTQHEQETGSPYFREPLDIVLAMLDEDEDLVSFYYDSRRFELYSN